MKKRQERVERMRRLVKVLKKLYGEPKTELLYEQPHELLFAVILSAQCTDKRVNMVTRTLFKKYPTLDAYARATRAQLRADIASISFPNNKAEHLRKTAERLLRVFDGVVPRSIEDLTSLYGVARKTANVVRGELYDEWDGIAIDTHVKRFVKKFDLSDATTPDAIERDLMSLVPKKDWKYVNNGLVLYGRYICTAHKHECEGHALTKVWPPAGGRWPRAT
jgi:endonuclease-3